MGELVWDDAVSSWLLLVIFLCLSSSICLPLVLVGPIVSGWSLSFLWACKPISAPLEDQLSPGTEGCGISKILGADGAWKDPVPAALPLLSHVCSWPDLPWTITREKMAISPTNLGVKAFPGHQVSPAELIHRGLWNSPTPVCRWIL